MHVFRISAIAITQIAGNVPVAEFLCSSKNACFREKV